MTDPTIGAFDFTGRSIAATSPGQEVLNRQRRSESMQGTDGTIWDRPVNLGEYGTGMAFERFLPP
jgi:hypothetical protein